MLRRFTFYVRFAFFGLLPFGVSQFGRYRRFRSLFLIETTFQFQIGFFLGSLSTLNLLSCSITCTMLITLHSSTNCFSWFNKKRLQLKIKDYSLQNKLHGKFLKCMHDWNSLPETIVSWTSIYVSRVSTIINAAALQPMIVILEPRWYLV